MPVINYLFQETVLLAFEHHCWLDFRSNIKNSNVYYSRQCTTIAQCCDIWFLLFCQNKLAIFGNRIISFVIECNSGGHSFCGPLNKEFYLLTGLWHSLFPKAIKLILFTGSIVSLNAVYTVI